ncbi:DUF1049 domain-containing protein [Rhodococcus triatomae]|uniref:Uncharacterized integral membrane protein n=1 Tax=Rhodococcus triatomae TaxID=300028 RepID=A0A1G8Q3D9_9NOCA|nr:lipopolysaccharide assembly protein LapA domain-containing protein [Rhodococcus triatomae]QNG19193.1 DUF1049 domain-containing protein [Rhodococcus triatomae]QNG24895.1 DUF1049 domain-containing protein [Rhodococcus triatomae]SDI99284.1 Uncharacterized integral membrane protein [Rhodococcus triatomae]
MSTTPDDPSSIPDPPDPGTTEHPDRAAETAGERTPEPSRRSEWTRITHTRAAYTWTGLVIGILVLILLLVFILQNLDRVTLKVFAWDFSVPLGITLLLAAIAGALIMGLAGGVRIVQIRRAIKRK